MRFRDLITSLFAVALVLSVANEASGGEKTTNTSQTAVYRVYETFLIEGETHAYLAQERLRWRWSKPANLTVNGPVKFAVEKRKLFVIDEDGKEHEMEIVKKVLRQPARRQEATNRARSGWLTSYR